MDMIMECKLWLPKSFLFKGKCGLGKCISTLDYKINNRTRRETVVSMPVAGHICLQQASVVIHTFVLGNQCVANSFILTHDAN